MIKIIYVREMSKSVVLLIFALASTIYYTLTHNVVVITTTTKLLFHKKERTNTELSRRRYSIQCHAISSSSYTNLLRIVRTHALLVVMVSKIPAAVPVVTRRAQISLTRFNVYY
jgi:hypothetical protein